jgi:hypothetical protein
MKHQDPSTKIQTNIKPQAPIGARAGEEQFAVWDLELLWGLDPGAWIF